MECEENSAMANRMSISCCHVLILNLNLDDGSGKKSKLCFSEREKVLGLLPVLKGGRDEAAIIKEECFFFFCRRPRGDKDCGLKQKGRKIING